MSTLRNETVRGDDESSQGVRVQSGSSDKEALHRETRTVPAFIFYYTKIHGSAPAESDMQNYFKISPPSVHQMVLTLEANGFIERVAGKGRSIRVLILREDLPDLE